MEPVARLLHTGCLRLDADSAGQLLAFRHRAGWRHRHGTSNTTAWYTITGALTAVTVTPSPASPQPANTPITLTATATGGTNVQYQFWCYNPAATPAWSQLQGYSTQSHLYVDPDRDGQLSVSPSPHRMASPARNVNATPGIPYRHPLTAVIVTTSPASPQPANTPITLTATATGGTNVQYQFWCYNPAATPAWSQLQGYSTQATCTWTPTMTGNYLLSVTAQDGVTGAIVNTTAWYAIAGTLTAVSFTPCRPHRNRPILPSPSTATATGGTNVQYQFWRL